MGIGPESRPDNVTTKECFGSSVDEEDLAGHCSVVDGGEPLDQRRDVVEAAHRVERPWLELTHEPTERRVGIPREILLTRHAGRDGIERDAVTRPIG